MKRELTCIVCPQGCSLKVEIEERRIKVSGNNCPRGEKYAVAECTHPERCVTTTVRCDNGEVVAVKTNCAIPKEKIFECMKIINKQIVTLPISIGDVIISDVFGADIVATQNKD